MNRKNNIFGLTLIGALFMMVACSSSSSTTDDSGGSTNPPSDSGNVAILYTTTSDGAHTLEQSTVSIQTTPNMAPSTIQLDDSKTYQTMDGFGFALTYSTCYNLMKMTSADREAFLKKTYSPTDGLGVNYARISIGCSDFSSTEYTLCDKKGIENFALQSDETNYIIPVIKEILSINPNLKIIASPWTCPKWMKVSDISTKTAYDSWTDGHLNPDYYDTYAQYFVKFVQAMKEKGISIYAVTPQNEPLNTGNCASLYMPWTEEAAFVKVLAGAFKSNSISTKIYLYDHNYDYDGKTDQNDYPVKIYNAIGNSFEGSEYVVGSAYHNYSGSNTELDDIHSQAPDKDLIFDEASIGTWNEGHTLSTRLVEDMKDITLGTVNRYCKAVLVWNLMLDSKRGPNLDGGCQTCYGAVDIGSDYKNITYNSHYYVICHMSSVVEPGAIRVGTSRDPELSGIVHSEFVNPDGTESIVILNSGDTDRKITVSDGTNHFMCSVPSGSVVSCKWTK
ncbi:MAG: glucosylceramidase [Prevotella sp.]|nr:glucosylceramidase [Prevotella sp.]MCI2087115.1 glucosylceramidase [Prevotella sp.]MCI2124192.1 glucosylceramidase [Prevotella sp.]